MSFEIFATSLDSRCPLSEDEDRELSEGGGEEGNIQSSSVGRPTS